MLFVAGVPVKIVGPGSDNGAKLSPCKPRREIMLKLLRVTGYIE
jgi:hypothetical protein